MAWSGQIPKSPISGETGVIIRDMACDGYDNDSTIANGETRQDCDPLFDFAAQQHCKVKVQSQDKSLVGRRNGRNI